MKLPISYGQQQIDDDDIQAVVETLKSDFLTQGPKIYEFEKAFANYIGSKYAVAVANGTAALHLSALALGVKPGDKVITSPITFVATANCVRYCGGEILFADTDPETYLIDLNQVEHLLKNEQNIKGIIPVDFAGRPVNLEEMRFLADKYNLWIIEDACHAPGGAFMDSKGTRQMCGNGNFADLAIFSFHPVKHIATGEGGMITTSSKGLYDMLNILRSHGITKDLTLMNENHGGWYYEMVELGFNYRLTDIQSALGISQLKKLDQNLQRRNLLAKKYDEAFNNIPFKRPGHQENIFHAYHLYVIETENRKSLYDFLKDNQIFAQVHYMPVHLQPYYRNLGWKAGDFPHAENYYRRCLSLPLYPTLSVEQQDYVIEKILSFHHHQ
jgi:UDP-4-amino-4,6-dideoxy-N-acetyl-beta-L-altrosamine transaminase